MPRTALSLVFAALLGAAAPGQAETWTVTTASPDLPGAVLTLERSGTRSISGTAEVQGADRSTRRAFVVGNIRDFILDIGGRTCMFRVSESSASAASGTMRCGSPPVAWSATIAGASVASAPTLLAPGEDPRQTAAYASLAPAARQAAEDEATQFVQNGAPEFVGLRDTACLADRYLNLRLQSRDLPADAIVEAIGGTCISIERARAWATAHCEEIYTGDDTPAAAVAEASGQPLKVDPLLCTCYGQRFADAFAANPTVNELGITAIGTAAYAACTSGN